SLAYAGKMFDADTDCKPEISFYNGYRAGEHIIGPMDYRDGGAVERGEHVGALKLSIDHMAAKGMQGRGVMIDLEHHCGRGASFVGYDQLMRIMEADKVEVEEGDIVCFRTGYDRVILGMNKNPDAKVLAANPGAGLDGRDERLLNWITRSGVVARPANAIATVLDSPHSHSQGPSPASLRSAPSPAVRERGYNASSLKAPLSHRGRGGTKPEELGG